MNKKPWQFLMNYGSPKEITLLVYGEIGDDEFWDEVVDKKFVEELESYTEIEKINVRINSPGGILFSGAAIANSLQQHSAEVHAYIDGLCASAATLIACAADKVYMPLNGMYMIHNPAAYGAGDSNQLRKTADKLDILREGVIAVYQNKVGEKLTKEEITNLLDEETWMTAVEAQEKGFVDEIIGMKIDTVLNKTQLNVNNLDFDMGKYKNFTQYYNKINEIKAFEKPEKKGVFKKILDLFTINKQIEEPKIENSAEKTKKDKEEEIMTIEELKVKYPEVYNQAFKEGTESERGRIQELEKLTTVANTEAGKKIINKAKYEEIKNAGEVAVLLLSSEEVLKEKENKETDEEKAKMLAELKGEGEELAGVAGGQFTPELKTGEDTDAKIEQAKAERRARMAAQAKKEMGVE